MERMKLTEKEKEQILKSGAEAMSKIIERMSIEMGELEEENKKLKEEVKDLVERNMEYEKKYNIVLSKVNKLEAENEGLKNTLYYAGPYGR